MFWKPSKDFQKREPMPLYAYQQTAVDQIVAAFEAGAENVLLDAPTGSGKTFIATAVLEQYGGLYGAASLDLQAQYQRDFPAVPLIQGHKNHCGDRMYDHQVASEVCPEMCGDRDGPYTYSSFSLVRHLVRTHGAPVTDPELAAMCSYAVAKEIAIHAPIANINPWYWLRELQGPAEFYGRDLAVVDEADQLESVADLSYSDAIAVSTLTDHGWRLPVDDWAPREHVERDLRAAQRVAYERYQHEVDVQERLAAFDLDVEAALRHKPKVDEARQTLDHIERIADKAGDPVYVTLWSREALTVVPVRPGSALEVFAWPSCRRRLFMSGSFVAPARWARWIGLDPASTALVTVPSQFEADRSPLTIWRGGPNMSARGYENEDKVAQMADAIRGYRRGRTLVHVSSASQAQTLARRIPGALTYASGDSSSRAKALAQYLRWEDSILIAQSLRRGVDLADGACRTNVVAKLPFPRLDRGVRARKDADPTYYGRQTAAEIVQALGRGMRHEGDWCCSYILDGALTPWLEKALPAHVREAIVS